MPLIDPATHPDTAAEYLKASLRLQEQQPQENDVKTSPWAQFLPPSYFVNFDLPKDAILVGDTHFTRGDVTLIGGVPGCGKSRLLVSLAIAGKEGVGSSWMGMPVHAPFKTAILQAENGEVRLKRELGAIAAQGHDLDDWLYISPPPRYGLAFSQPDFRAFIRDWLAEVKPGVFAIDPFNRVAMDDKVKDFRQAFDQIMSVLPDGPEKPAVAIIHHLRKQTGGEYRKRGRDLLTEVSGSYSIGSNSRTVFILEPVTPDGDDDRLVFTCAKSNNGDMEPSTAWHRRDGLFAPCEEFDWEEWKSGGAMKRQGIDLSDVAAIFNNGELTLSRPQAVSALKERGYGQTAAYDALKINGRFAEHLSECGGFLNFKP